ncbi:MAG: DNA-processing protein DprA [Clostridia bacterium]|nr:DNA-processing protein DprA [Clostridia bacterium]MBQ4624624.1 DNA-processing protein DprA [Clostridia bacterium]
MASVKHWIWLAELFRSGKRVNELLEHFGSPEEVFHASVRELKQVPSLRDEDREAILCHDLTLAEEIRAACKEKGIHIVTYQDSTYPASLRSIPNPPLVLYYYGELPEFSEVLSVAVVGTRHASFYGRSIAENLGNRLAKSGVCLVSGMAEGVDSASTRGAIKTGNPGVVVLGTPIDVCYPRSSRDVYDVLKKDGAVISEYPPGGETFQTNFPARNRIISGLSQGVVVVEAPLRSGSLITARVALEQGRDVFVVPGNIDVPSFEGSNRLLVNGEGKAITSVRDILVEYEGLYKKVLSESEAEKGLHIKSIEEEPTSTFSEPTDPATEAIKKALIKEGLSAEDIMTITSLAPSDLQFKLTLMELEGTIKSDGGKFYLVR